MSLRSGLLAMFSAKLRSRSRCALPCNVVPDSSRRSTKRRLPFLRVEYRARNKKKKKNQMNPADRVPSPVEAPRFRPVPSRREQGERPQHLNPNPNVASLPTTITPQKVITMAGIRNRAHSNAAARLDKVVPTVVGRPPRCQQGWLLGGDGLIGSAATENQS